MNISHVNAKKNSTKVSYSGPPGSSLISIPILKLQLNYIKTETSKYWNKLNSCERHGCYSSLNVWKKSTKITCNDPYQNGNIKILKSIKGNIKFIYFKFIVKLN